MEHADVVVVGSGFGGAVTAYRLADAGLKVVLLERGREWPPGSFPRTPAQMNGAFWDPKEGLHGLFDVWSFAHCDSLVSSGIGGGSLIYANVLLRKDEDTFVSESALPGGGYEHWPISRADLDPHYDEVEKMMGATPYPADQPAYGGTPKTRALQDAAAELGLDWSLPPLGVSFAPKPGALAGLGLPIVESEQGGYHDAARRTCKLCGECNIGCNEGAKNSLDHTYLAAARRKGADIRPLHEVRVVRANVGGGYDVGYVQHDPFTGPHTISCDRLVLAAGTYGTNRLLMRNRRMLPGLSAALGTRFCGNGDLISFLLRSRERRLAASAGPVITSTIRLPDGAYIQEGGFPGFVDWLVEAAQVGDEVSRMIRFVADRLFARDGNMSAEMSRLVGRGDLSDRSMPVLGMGRDVADGVLRLDGSRLALDWNAETSQAYFDRLRGAMRRIGDVLGADYVDAPLGRILTVHPLGGAPMGRHRGEGVVDENGEVFGHPGLYVADGAAMPGSIGPNPALTIAAIADRMAVRIVETKEKPVRGSAYRPASPNSTTLSFTEEMRGSLDGTDPISFRITVVIDDVTRFLEEPEHLARVDGYIDAAVCGGRRPIERGWFNLFAPGDAPDRRQMRYRLHFWDGENQPRTLVGHKDVRHGPPTRLWLETSTLHAKLLEDHVPLGEQGRPLAVGTLHITPSDLVRMITTFDTDGPRPMKALKDFGSFFLGELWDMYGPA